jgi:hypothetical protein
LHGELALIKSGVEKEVWARARLTILGEVRELLAGATAEEIAFGFDASQEAWSRVDTEQAEAKVAEVCALENLDEVEHEHLLWIQRLEVERVLRLPTSWRAVKAIAQELLESGHVSMDRASELTSRIRVVRGGTKMR